jgi:hypothetical protein
MKGILIKGWYFMTDVCQECPCFVNYRINSENPSWIQACKVNGYKIIRGPVFYDDLPNDWQDTPRPEWCPVEVVDA